MWTNLKRWLRPRWHGAWYYEIRDAFDRWESENRAWLEKWDRLIASEKERQL